MNKAFVREPDPTDMLHCPRCGSLGIAVGVETLDAQLLAEARSKLGSCAWFCPFPTCEVVYFDAFERCSLREDSRWGVYPKDPTAPICACFGFTCEEIEADLRDHSVDRTRAAVARAKTAGTSCLVKSATGQSCASEIQRYYMRRRQQV